MWKVQNKPLENAKQYKVASVKRRGYKLTRCFNIQRMKKVYYMNGIVLGNTTCKHSQGEYERMEFVKISVCAIVQAVKQTLCNEGRIKRNEERGRERGTDGATEKGRIEGRDGGKGEGEEGRGKERNELTNEVRNERINE